MLKIVCLSDTHNCNEQIVVPDGDILIHAGDATIRGTEREVEDFLAWFSSLPHKHKIFVWVEVSEIFMSVFDLSFICCAIVKCRVSCKS